MSHRRKFGFVVGMILGVMPFGGRVCAQDPETAAIPTPAPGPASVGDVSAFYRLMERFTAKEPQNAPGMIGQNQVALQETTTANDASGKPATVVRRAIYSERPASVSPVDDRVVIESVKHFTSFAVTPDPWKGRTDRRPLDDLTIWYREVPGVPPAVIVLTPDRQLREEEYKIAINYNFVSNLAFLMPDLPQRIGETWPVNRIGAIALVNDDVREGTLTGKLVEIQTHPKIQGMQVAILEIAGRIGTGFDGTKRDTAVRARIHFAFTPVKQGETNIDGSGFIEKIALAQVSSMMIPGQTARTQIKRELHLERKIPGTDAPLTIPDPAPTLTIANSWLTFVDPDKRYNLRHPQGFQPSTPPDMPGVVDLKRFVSSDMPDDIVRMTYIEKPTTKPEASFKAMVDEWRAKGVEVIAGTSEKLPAADWPGLSVSHMEAALSSPAQQNQPAGRRYYDAYVIQFPRNASLYVSATTSQSNPSEFRQQVLAMLKTVKLDTPRP